MKRGVLPLQIVVAIFLALRLYYDFTADLFGDEAYYYLWGQHLSWSYFDHPPLHAWLIRLSSEIFHDPALSLRALMWLTLAGVLAIFWDWSKRIAPDDRERWFWTAAALYLSSPLFFGFTLIAYHDHLLILLCLAAIHCFVLFVTRFEADAPRALRWLYAAALLLGLAALTKYNGVFLGLGFALAFLVRPKLRRVLLTPHPWLAALLALLIQTPVVYWNLTEGLASFRFHFAGRWGGHAGQANWWHPARFLLLSFGIWSPVLIWPLLRLIRTRPALGFESAARTVALATFIVSTIVLTVVSIVLDSFFYWNIVGLVGLMPLLAGYIGNRVVLWLQLLFGLVCAILIVVNFAVAPLAAFTGGKDTGSAVNFGWPEIAAHMRAAEAAHPTDFIAGTGYSNTAQLSVALAEDVVDLSPNPSQFSYWFPTASYAGKSALILEGEDDKASEIANIRDHFRTLVQVDEFTISRHNAPLYTWKILMGEDWQP